MSDRPASDAATCSRCGHEKAEHGNDVLPFAPCRHLEGRPATTRLVAFAYSTESCWCSNYEEAEHDAR